MLQWCFFIDFLKTWRSKSIENIDFDLQSLNPTHLLRNPFLLIPLPPTEGADPCILVNLFIIVFI